MELLALLLIVILLRLLWYVAVPDSEGETSRVLVHHEPSDFSLELARSAAERQSSTPRKAA